MVATDSTVLRGIAEFFEHEIGESLTARTECLATFRELGPPDLCHIIKSNPKHSPKEFGCYHYVVGSDTSSSATVAAYLNSLIYLLGSATDKKNPWKITSGTYCCFNAFSRVDVRVDVRIPGGCEAYIVDLRGDRHPITDASIWQETYVSAILRGILDDNDEPRGNDGYPLLGLRKLDPLPTLASEKRFLEAASEEFWKGWQLGTEPEVQVATYCSNHLSLAIFKYFSDAGRLSEACKFFLNLFNQEPQVAPILARAYLGTDEEIKAVQIMYDALKKTKNYEILLVQVDFLMSKKQYEKALKIAKIAVTYAPSEFIVWARLAEIYIEIGDFESALLSLNSCPMFTYCERDAHRMPPPARTHLPLRPDTSMTKNEQEKAALPQSNGALMDENDPRENEVHPELQRLPSLSLKGTFSSAYSLLVKICTKVGWDDLLKFRSNVFVMEEEYKVHRSIVQEAERSGKEEDEVSEAMETIALDSREPSPVRTNTGKTALNIDELLKRTADTRPTEGTKKAPNPRHQDHRVSFSFKQKRICEKWLDNLFMVLYNDLRLYTALKQEMTQFKFQSSNTNVMMYRKTGAEWEIYGDLSLRLGHMDDARDSYSLATSQKISTQSLVQLFQMAAQDGQITQCLTHCVKLVGFLDRTFMEHTYPSIIARGLFTLIRRTGLAKVQNALISLNVPQGAFRYITRYFEYAELFRIAGSDW